MLSGNLKIDQEVWKKKKVHCEQSSAAKVTRLSGAQTIKYILTNYSKHNRVM